MSYFIVCNDFQMRCVLACGLDKYLRAAPFFVGNQLLRFKPPGCSDGADSLWNHNLCSEGGHMVLPEVEKDNFFISSLQHCTLTVKSKRLADLLEALIGAFFLSDGIKGATFICQAAGCWPRSIPAPVILPSPPPLTEKVAETSVIETRPCIPDGYPDQLKRIALNEDSFEYASSEDLFGYAPPAEGACQLSADYIQERIGYRFANPELLQEVFTHPSVSSARRSSYQRLEFLGDAVLDVAVVVLLYASESMHDQGALTTLKSNATNNRKLGTLAITLGLYKLLKFNSETLQNAFQIILIHQESAEGFKDVEEVLVSALDTMADCFEALVGAVYLDSNHSLDTIKQIVLKLGMIDPALL